MINYNGCWLEYSIGEQQFHISNEYARDRWRKEEREGWRKKKDIKKNKENYLEAFKLQNTSSCANAFEEYLTES